MKAEAKIKTIAALLEHRKAEIEADDRFTAPTATVAINEPLALIQLALEVEHIFIRKILAMC